MKRVRLVEMDPLTEEHRTSCWVKSWNVNLNLLPLHSLFAEEPSVSAFMMTLTGLVSLWVQAVSRTPHSPVRSHNQT